MGVPQEYDRSRLLHRLSCCSHQVQAERKLEYMRTIPVMTNLSPFRGKSAKPCIDYNAPSIHTAEASLETAAETAARMSFGPACTEAAEGPQLQGRPCKVLSSILLCVLFVLEALWKLFE